MCVRIVYLGLKDTVSTIPSTFTSKSYPISLYSIKYVGHKRETRWTEHLVTREFQTVFISPKYTSVVQETLLCWINSRGKRVKWDTLGTPEDSRTTT